MHSKLDYEDITRTHQFSEYVKGDKMEVLLPFTGDTGTLPLVYTAVRSAVVRRTSRPHPGKSKDRIKLFDKLFEELVK